MAHIEIRTEIDAPVEVVFDLARNIDAHLGSMGKSREQAIAGVASGLIGLGEQVTWKARHFGVPFKMTSKVTAMTAPDRFVDEDQGTVPERQYLESIAAENSARHEAELEYEPTLSDMRSYAWALGFPALLLSIGLGWVSEQLGIGRGPGAVAGALIWLAIYAVMGWRWRRARFDHCRAKQPFRWRRRLRVVDNTDNFGHRA